MATITARQIPTASAADTFADYADELTRAHGRRVIQANYVPGRGLAVIETTGDNAAVTARIVQDLRVLFPAASIDWLG